MVHAPEANITREMIAAIVARYGLGTQTATQLVHVGTSHTIYFLDDAFVLRIPRSASSGFSGVAYEAWAVPAARAVGVRTPALIAFDDTHEILSVPYTIMERVHGVALHAIDLPPKTIPDVWRSLGQDLACLHSNVLAVGAVAQIPADAADLDPRPWLQEIEAAGLLPPCAAAYLRAWLEHLAPLAVQASPRCFCHGDVNLGNILIDPATHAYLGLIDWAGAMWGDNAYDLAVVSLGAAPLLIEGYRITDPMAADTTLEARVLWQHLRLGLWGLRRAHQRDAAWINHRVARLFEGMHLFLASPSARWLAQLGPSAPS